MNIKNIVIPSRYVMVECPPLVEDVKLGEVTLKIDTSYAPENYVSVRGTVAALPKKLPYDRGNVNQSMEWKTVMELHVGDKVWFDYYSALMAFGLKSDKFQEYPDPKWIEADGKTYVFLRYDDIFCYESSDGAIIPINGYNLVKRVEKPVGKLEFVTDYEDYVEVISPGRANDEYLNPEYSDGEVSYLDKVILKKPKSKYNVQRESIYLRPIKLDSGDFHVVQGRWLMGVYEGYKEAEKS